MPRALRTDSGTTSVFVLPSTSSTVGDEDNAGALGSEDSRALSDRGTPKTVTATAAALTSATTSTSPRRRIQGVLGGGFVGVVMGFSGNGCVPFTF
jgi:hypothetical protein